VRRSGSSPGFHSAFQPALDSTATTTDPVDFSSPHICPPPEILQVIFEPHTPGYSHGKFQAGKKHGEPKSSVTEVKLARVALLEDAVRCVQIDLQPDLLEMCSGSEVGSYLRLVDFCITQLKAWE